LRGSTKRRACSDSKDAQQGPLVIRRIGRKVPKIAGSAFVSEAAYVVGDVEIGERSSVWPGAVIRADIAGIRIGANVVVEDKCSLHADTSMEIGDNVILGHGAVLHDCKVGSSVLIGMNATALKQSEIGDNCVIGAGAVVGGGQKIPPGSVAVGVPARIVDRAGIHLGDAEGGDWEDYHKLAERYKEAGL
jgi:carbonic anhydrase/acetyltransferase-like protein (isoleucine patch superfamily)